MIDRRQFLKMGGATAFAALFSGCGELPKKIVPFVIPPDDCTLGESLRYASLCRMCPAGCGILVRVSEGRAKKIEGNPLHPVNRGKLCARGQAGLQRLYHPERLGTPLRLDGPRGSGRFRPVSWEEALSLLLGKLKEVRAQDPKSLLSLGEPLRGHRNLVAARFMSAFGSPHRLAWDPFGLDAHLAANESVLGVRDVPEYDIASASYVLSFSGDFLETWLSPVHYGYAYGRMRNARETIRGKMVHFGSRLSMTAASADLFLPAAPGTEGSAALGIAHVMVRDKLTPEAAAAGHLWAAGLSAWTPEAAAAKSGAPAKALAGVAREFARARPAGIAIAGTQAASTTNGAFNCAAAALLNALNGAVGKPGGIAFFDRTAAVAGAGRDAQALCPPPESGYGPLREAIERMRAGKFRMALLHGDANPAFTLPAALRFDEALGKVPFVVSFASFLDETTSLSDLVLPVPTYLEEWGDDVAPAGHAGNALTLAQPAVRPFRDTRSMEDVLIAAAKELGGPLAAALPWKDFRALLEQAHGGTRAWEDALQAGGRFGKAPGHVRPAPKAARPAFPKPAEPEFAGDPATHPLVLVVYPSIAHGDGRGANLSWLQELPDPMSTVMWRNWVEVNPRTAAQMGLSDGDGVVVESPFGRIEAHVAYHPGIMPGVAAMPLGQGHTRYGKNAAGRGGSPWALLPAAREGATGAPAWQSTRVRLVKAKVAGRLARAAHPEGQWKIGNLM